MEAFIAIDGGGSKTEVLLIDILGNVLSRIVVDCTNPNDVGMDNSFLILSSAIETMLGKGKEYDLDINKIFLLIAGIEFGDSKEILKNKLIQKFDVNEIYVDGDLASVKECGLHDKENGIVIISGTGFNMAIKDNGEFRNIGGWGYLCDDYLSGFDLGKDALIYASNAIDGVGEETLLVGLLEEKFSHSLWYSMKEIYDSGIKGVASLSKVVVEAYKRNDKVATKIIDSRIEKLANTIKDNTFKEEILDVVLFGGIFENNPFIVEKLSNLLGDNYKLNVTPFKTVYGTVSIGYKSYKLNNKAFYKIFDENYKECLR